MRAPILMAGLLMLTGCLSSTPVNPSFPISADDARDVLAVESSHPKPLDRPLVIVGGFFDPGIAAAALGRDFHNYTHDDRIISVSLDFGFDEEVYRKRIIDAVEKAFPSNNPNLTTEV